MRMRLVTSDNRIAMLDVGRFGSWLASPCPFHTDHNPQFPNGTDLCVNPVKLKFKCLSCGVEGNASASE